MNRRGVLDVDFDDENDNDRDRALMVSATPRAPGGGAPRRTGGGMGRIMDDSNTRARRATVDELVDDMAEVDDEFINTDTEGTDEGQPRGVAPPQQQHHHRRSVPVAVARHAPAPPSARSSSNAVQRPVEMVEYAPRRAAPPLPPPRAALPPQADVDGVSAEGMQDNGDVVGGGDPGGGGVADLGADVDIVMDCTRAPLRGFEWFHALPESTSRYCYVCWTEKSPQNRYLEIVNDLFARRAEMSDEHIVHLVYKVYESAIRPSPRARLPAWDKRTIYTHMTEHVTGEESMLVTTIRQSTALANSLVNTFERVLPADGSLMAPDPRTVKTLLSALSMQSRLAGQLATMRMRATAAGT